MNKTTCEISIPLPILDSFRAHIWSYYHLHGRTFAWREAPHDPYHILISEVMLQQTQTHRVIEKFDLFTSVFPTLLSLAHAPLRDVLHAWQGLGYNRRGKFLHQAAQEIEAEYKGKLPADPDLLVALPGIGKATAASICAFAFNMPTIFIETNIRTVFIHHFYPGRNDVQDKELFPLIAATVDEQNPREWYYALMDYGVYLKKVMPNPSRKSAHHSTQSKFEGSDRQIRGAIIRLLTQHPALSQEELLEAVGKEPERVLNIIGNLAEEQMIVVCQGNCSIK